MISKLKVGLRRLIPAETKERLTSTRFYLRHRSEYTNVYHCTVHKAASQWIKAIMSDSRVYRHSGLKHYNYHHSLPTRYDPRMIKDIAFYNHFPERTIISPIYISFDNFSTFPKPQRYRAFFVMRDPRDLVVSWYFSTKYSHPPIGRIPELREALNGLSLKDGLLYAINFLAERGTFYALRSWIDAPERDPNVLLVRFEDVTSDSKLKTFCDLFSHCDIRISQESLTQLLDDYSFKRLSGRERGSENKQNHYRKGKSGDWRNWFDEMITAKFKMITGDLVTYLGYESDSSW